MHMARASFRAAILSGRSTAKSESEYLPSVTLNEYRCMSLPAAAESRASLEAVTCSACRRGNQISHSGQIRGIPNVSGLAAHDLDRRMPRGRDQSATLYRPKRSRSVSARLIRS
jgi:hypothetical protein